MARKSTASVKVSPNVRCLRVYPSSGSVKTIRELKTVGLKLSREQATHLATVLLVAAQQWDELEITGYRNDPRKSDGTYHITMTSAQEE